MIALTNSITDFIKDFHLVQQDGAISFKATVYFTTISECIRLITEVQIVKGNSWDTLYLTHRDVSSYKLPEIYQEGVEEFSYFKNLALLVKGDSHEYGEYILSIQPGRVYDEKVVPLYYERTRYRGRKYNY